MAVTMANYGHRGPLQTIAIATVLLVAVAVGAHVAWTFLEPMLPSLIGVFIIVMVAYLLLGRR
jgi:hypothetical protein